MEKLRQNLILERKTLKLRQQDVAERIGVPTTTYGGWERGDAEPSVEMLIKLADLFDCTVDELLGRTDGVTSNSAVNETHLSADEKQLIDLYRKLLLRDKAEAMGFIKGLLF